MGGLDDTIEASAVGATVGKRAYYLANTRAVVCYVTWERKSRLYAHTMVNVGGSFGAVTAAWEAKPQAGQRTLPLLAGTARTIFAHAGLFGEPSLIIWMPHTS